MGAIRIGMVVATGLAVAGCAAPPNTPGAGVGATYTPVVDLRGVDGGRYASDLQSCRAYADSIDPTKRAIGEAIGQAIISGLIMQAAGGNRTQIERSGNVGGNVGFFRGMDRAQGTQERIIANCLASRGYRVLDGTAQVSFVQQAGQPAAAPQGHPLAASDGLVQLPTPAPNPLHLSQPKAVGVDSYAAERVARDAKCNTTGLANLVAKGPGYESYSMQCTSGDVMMIRCEFGNCRALK